MIKNIDEAIRIIKTTMSNNTDGFFPYFFIVGAGVSVPEIPAAKAIIDNCKKKIKAIDPAFYEEYEKASQPFIENPMKYYSSWIEYAYPNRKDRSNLFKQLNAQAKISSANLILAQILDSKKFANTVFTTNFDDRLKTALDLLGNKSYFCAENTMDNKAINTHTKDIQIVHLHGTYNFYDCANLESEISEVATESNIMSSRSLLSAFLHDQAPIIVGYSGWENDVIMTCLKERLKDSTPFQYFWVCYDKKSYDNIPNWIKTSNSVIFVVPQENVGNCFEGCENDGDSFLENKHKPQTIDATKFFKRLVAEFSIESPLIFLDPHSYYSQEINRILPENEDVLHLKHWAQRLKILKSNETDFEKHIQKLEGYFISKEYLEAKKELKKINKLKLTKTDVEFVCFSIIKEFVDDEEDNFLDEQKIEFHFAALEFIELNFKNISNKKALVQILHSLLFANLDYPTRDKMQDLFKKVQAIATRDKNLLEIELVTIGVLSEYQDKNTKKLMLEEILRRCPNKSVNGGLMFLKFRTLCNLCTLVEIEKAIKMISMAEKLARNLKGENLKLDLYNVKSKLISDITDKKIQAKWIEELLNIIKDNETNKESSTCIEIASNLLSVGLSGLLETNNTEDELKSTYIKLLSGYEINPFNCRNMLAFSRCCRFIYRTSSDIKEQYEYALKIFSIKDDFPHECESFNALLRDAIFTIIELPVSIVDDKTKKEIVAATKTDKTINVYYEVLYFLTNTEYINDLSEFECDINIFNNESNSLSEAVGLYKSQHLENAEKLFIVLQQAKSPSVSDLAKTNLSFMVRRKETQENNDFWGIISTIKILSDFDWMNIALYCLENNETDKDIFNDAIDTLKNLTEDAYEHIISCWGDVNLVGEDESQLALSLIEKNIEKLD